MPKKEDKEMIRMVEETILRTIKTNANRDDSTIKRSRDKKEGAAKRDILDALVKDNQIACWKVKKTISSKTELDEEMQQVRVAEDYIYYADKVIKKLLKEGKIVVTGKGKGTRYVYNEPKLKVASLKNRTIQFYEILSGDICKWLPIINEKLNQLDKDYKIHLIPIGNYLMCIDETLKNSSRKNAPTSSLRNAIENAIISVGCDVVWREVK